MLIRHHRLRNQFEPKGRERQTLRTSARISRQCILIRDLNADPPDRIRGIEHRLRSALVLWLTLTGLSWQSRYNVACFDALRLEGIPQEKPTPPLGRRARLRWSARKWRRARIERRALRNLDRGIREAAGALSRQWVENDPDMRAFRQWKQTKASNGFMAFEAHPDWQKIVDRAPSAITSPRHKMTAAPSPKENQVASVPLADARQRWRDDNPAGVPTKAPARPWGSARVRKWLWLGSLALTLVALVAFAIVTPSSVLGIFTLPLGLLVGIIVSVIVARWAGAARFEQRLGA
jgi:hypothetical protein